MVKQVVLISARRAYEFTPDGLRLTLLTTAEIRQKVAEAFSFQAHQIAPPMETFGPVPQTLPPGLVFNWGSLSLGNGNITGIRFLHFEPQRLVIDVAGPSAAIDRVFERIRAMIADYKAPDGTPIIGKPTETHNWSELSANLGFGPLDLVSLRVQQVYERAIKRIGSDHPLVPVPSLSVQPVRSDEPYPGSVELTRQTSGFLLDLRKDSPLGSPFTYFSQAPLDTDAHLAYLTDLETTLQELALFPGPSR